MKLMLNCRRRERQELIAQFGAENAHFRSGLCNLAHGTPTGGADLPGAVRYNASIRTWIAGFQSTTVPRDHEPSPLGNQTPPCSLLTARAAGGLGTCRHAAEKRSALTR